MDYKEYMELAFELRNGWERERKAATAITDLLARAEEAEVKSTAVMMVNKSLSEALKNAEARAEKAERERDAAISGAVSVVRCRECKHNDGEKQICTLTGVYFLEDDFCSRGERSTDNSTEK